LRKAKPWGYVPESTVRASLVNGFQVFADDAIPLLVLGFVVVVVGAACGSILLFVEGGLFYTPALYITITGPLELGMSFVCLRAVRSGRVNIEHLFAIFGRYWQLVLANGLMAMILPGLFAILVIPGLAFYCATRFVPFLLLEDELTGAKAVLESIRLSRSCFWQLLGVCAVGSLATVLGGIFILGLVPALIWWNLSLASLYHAKVRPPSGWALEDAEEIEMLQTQQQ
jgi:hypothetical protein